MRRATFEERAASRIVPAACPMQPSVVAKQPAESEIPFANDDVAFEVERMLPPEITRPREVERPAVETPPANVELEVFVTERFVAVVDPRSAPMFVALIEPPETVTPFEEEIPAPAIPPEKVEVAPPVIDDVALPDPRRICWVVRNLESKPAAVMKPPTAVEVAEPVIVSVPTEAVLATVSAVPADENVLVPVNVWPERLRRATFELSAASAIVPASWPTQPRADLKQPAVILNPLFEVVVAPDVMRSAPPVRVKPFDAARPDAEIDESVFVAVFD